MITEPDILRHTKKMERTIDEQIEANNAARASTPGRYDRKPVDDRGHHKTVSRSSGEIEKNDTVTVTSLFMTTQMENQATGDVPPMSPLSPLARSSGSFSQDVATPGPLNDVTVVTVTPKN